MPVVRYLVVRLVWLFIMLTIIFIITYYVSRVSHLMIWTPHYSFFDNIRIATVGFKEFMRDLLFGVVEQASGRETVQEQFVRAAPVSLFIVAIGFLYAFIVGVFLGILSAIFHRSWFDRIISNITLFFASIPAYLWVIVFMVYFTWQRDLLPGLYPAYPSDIGPPPISLQMIGLIIPVVALSFYPVAMFAQLVRGELIELSTSNTLVLAKAKGLTPRRALLKHTLPLSFLPLIRQIPNMFTFMLFNAFVVEVAYNVPGIARWMYHSMIIEIFDSGQFFIDPPVVVAVSMFYAVLMLVMTFLSDFTYVLFDPRIKIHSKKT